ncbi:hypothetical protein C0992_005388 [Termitomyces sp. T32_za158]|nr:hypothetical protein C0992_005388 [Termitomyces sp. T32_za158]
MQNPETETLFRLIATDNTNNNEKAVLARTSRTEPTSSKATLEKVKHSIHDQDLAFWSRKVANVDASVTKIIGKSPHTYFECLFETYQSTVLPNNGANTIFEDATLCFYELITKVQRSQAEILQLEGVGEEWRHTDDVLKRIKGIILWLEDLIAHTLISPDSIVEAHHKKELVYQTD